MDSYNLPLTLHRLTRPSPTLPDGAGILTILALTKGTPMADLDYQDMFRSLPAEKQKELMDRHSYFCKLAEISL